MLLNNVIHVYVNTFFQVDMNGLTLQQLYRIN